MATHSISSMILRVRRLSDVVNNTNATTSAEVQQYLWTSLYELQQTVAASSDGDWWLALSTSGSATAGTATYAITASTDVFQIKGVDVKLGTTSWQPIAPCGFHERDKYSEDPAYPYWNPRLQYRIFSRPVLSSGTLSMFSTRILFIPTPTESFSYRVWYIPAPDLSSVTSFATIPPLWDEYAVVDAALKIATRDEADTKPLQKRLDGLKDTILRVSSSQDLGFPAVVEDTSRFREP